MTWTSTKGISLLLLIGTLAFSAAASASPYVVDGDLADWLAGPPKGNASDWTPWSDHSLKWVVEDQNSSYLNPGYGGQPYDAEAIYIDLIDDDLYIAVVTGRAPNAAGYPGGDIALNLNWVVGTEDASFEIGVITRDHDGFRSGDVVEVAEWYYGLWIEPDEYDPSGSSDYKSAHPVGVKSGDKLGKAELVYTEALYDGDSIARLGEYTGSHYVIETKLDLSVLGIDLGNDPFLAHWTAWCANDWIQVDPDPQSIPTPSTLFLLVPGFLGLFRLRRKV